MSKRIGIVGHDRGLTITSRGAINKGKTAIVETELMKKYPHTKLKKTPKMPFSKISDYISEFKKISNKQSKLTSNQRTHVVNIIHSYARQGKLTLK